MVSQYCPGKMASLTHVGHGKDSSTSLHSDIVGRTLCERFSEFGVKTCQGGKIGFDLIEPLDRLVSELVGWVGGRTDSSNGRP
jgi:hypothetical protein